MDQPHYSLRNLRIPLLNGKAPNVISLDINRNFLWDKKHPGQSLVPSQVFMGEDVPEITGVAYNDEQMSFGDDSNVAVATFDIISPNDGDNASFLGSTFLARFPPSSMTIVLEKTSLEGEKVSTVNFSIKCNVLNPGVDGGFPEPTAPTTP
jgi:hypothetical protein